MPKGCPVKKKLAKRALLTKLNSAEDKLFFVQITTYFIIHYWINVSSSKHVTPARRFSSHSTRPTYSFCTHWRFFWSNSRKCEDQYVQTLLRFDYWKTVRYRSKRCFSSEIWHFLNKNPFWNISIYLLRGSVPMYVFKVKSVLISVPICFKF